MTVTEFFQHHNLFGRERIDAIKPGNILDNIKSVRGVNSLDNIKFAIDEKDEKVESNKDGEETSKTQV